MQYLTKYAIINLNMEKTNMNRITQKEFLYRLKNSTSLIMKELYSQYRYWINNDYKIYEHNENLLLISGKDKYEVNMFIFTLESCYEL